MDPMNPIMNKMYPSPGYSGPGMTTNGGGAAPMYGSGGMTPLPWLNRGGGGLFPGAGGGGPRPLPGSTGGGWGTPPWGGQSGSAQPRGVAFRPNPQPLPWTAQPQPAPMAPGGQGGMGSGWNPYGNESNYWGGPSAGVVGGPQNTNGGFMPGTMPQGPTGNIWQTPTQQGAPSNVVQGSAGLNMNQKAWGMGNLMNYGQLDPTGTRQWVGGGGGEQGQWQNYNPNDPNQRAVADQFNRYGSNWSSGAAGAYGHSSEMPAHFQALYGRQGTPQELSDMYYNVNGDAARAHDAFANQSAAYNPASSAFNPQAVQNLTSLNLLAHQ